MPVIQAGTIKIMNIISKQRPVTVGDRQAV